MILQMFFWLLLLLIFWTYFGYPIMLQLLSIFFAKKIAKQDIHPGVSIVITAYNEELRIRQKIENTLALTYPSEKLEIIVVSDGSTDKTTDIVRLYEAKGVRLLAIPERHGKHYGQGEGIAIANHDIIVFTDATTFLKADAIEKIVRNFADSEIGCVSGLDVIQSDGANVPGEGIYVKYEMKLRTLENTVGSLVGVSGCFFAVRKHLCDDWIVSLSNDFYIPIVAYMKGYRTVLEKEAIGYYEVLHEPQKEFFRKVRTVVHGLEVLFKFKSILNPLKYGMYSFQMLSHKLSRWLVPLYLILLLGINFLLVEHSIYYLITMILQVVFYLLALLAFLVTKFKKIILFRIPFFFVMVNFSILVAWWKYMRGEEYILWEPTKR